MLPAIFPVVPPYPVTGIFRQISVKVFQHPDQTFLRSQDVKVMKTDEGSYDWLPLLPHIAGVPRIPVTEVVSTDGILLSPTDGGKYHR
jgi:hypothetical protein